MLTVQFRGGMMNIWPKLPIYNGHPVTLFPDLSSVITDDIVYCDWLDI